MKFWVQVFALPTRLQNELIRSSSRKLPIWKAVIKKLFVFYLCLKENRAESLIAAIFDCLCGPGAGYIFESNYESLVTFGPSAFIPSMTLIIILLGLSGFIGAWLQGFNGFLNKTIQILILMWSTFFNWNVLTAALLNPPTGVNSLVLCRSEKCIRCFREFPKVFITSKSDCGCVCERCYRTAKDCGNCKSAIGTVHFLEANRVIQVIQVLPMTLLFFQLTTCFELTCLKSFGIDTCIFVFQCLSYSAGAGITICVILREGFRILQRLHKILKQEFPWLLSSDDSSARSMPSSRETKIAVELEPSIFDRMMLRKLTELVETIAQQKVEMTNQQKEFIQQRKTFNQKQDQMESKIKEILDEQRHMNNWSKQEKVQQQKVTLLISNLSNSLDKMERQLENNHEEVIFKQQELKKLCLDTRLSLNNQVKQQGLLQNLVLDLKPPNEKAKNQNVTQSDPESVNECKICMERPLDAVLKNCGHTMCFECAKKMKREKKDCPTCREKIVGFQKIFL